MLNLVVLSLGIVASKADLSCNGLSVETDTGFYMSFPAGVCNGIADYQSKWSSQYVCKGGKIHIVDYASSSNCTGDFTEYEYCSTFPYFTNCTSVCDQDPCEYIKEVIYNGVTSCDPIVVSSTTVMVSNMHITGQCRPEIIGNGSTSMLCDSSTGTAQYVRYTSDDCTGDSNYSWNLTTTCHTDIDNGHANIYSCGTANGVQIAHTPETTIEEVKGNIEDFGTSNPSDVFSFGIFVVMVFIVGMLSWM